MPPCDPRLVFFFRARDYLKGGKPVSQRLGRPRNIATATCQKERRSLGDAQAYRWRGDGSYLSPATTHLPHSSNITAPSTFVASMMLCSSSPFCSSLLLLTFVPTGPLTVTTELPTDLACL
jgi:hypothetical protein